MDCFVATETNAGMAPKYALRLHAHHRAAVASSEPCMFHRSQKRLTPRTRLNGTESGTRTHNHRLLRPARLPVAPPGLRQRKTPCGRAEGVSGNRANTAAISRCNPPALREAGQAGCIGCCDECSLGADSVRRFIRCQAVFRIPGRATQVQTDMILRPVTRTTTVRPSAPALRPILAP